MKKGKSEITDANRPTSYPYSSNKLSNEEQHRLVTALMGQKVVEQKATHLGKYFLHLGEANILLKDKMPPSIPSKVADI